MEETFKGSIVFGNTIAWLSGMGAGSLDMVEEAEKEV